MKQDCRCNPPTMSRGLSGTCIISKRRKQKLAEKTNGKLEVQVVIPIRVKFPIVEITFPAVAGFLRG